MHFHPSVHVKHAKLTIALFWILRARFAYFKVLRVSSAFVSAGLTQAETGTKKADISSLPYKKLEILKKFS